MYIDCSYYRFELLLFYYAIMAGNGIIEQCVNECVVTHN